MLYWSRMDRAGKALDLHDTSAASVDAHKAAAVLYTDKCN